MSALVSHVLASPLVPVVWAIVLLVSQTKPLYYFGILWGERGILWQLFGAAVVGAWGVVSLIGLDCGGYKLFNLHQSCLHHQAWAILPGGSGSWMRVVTAIMEQKMRRPDHQIIARRFADTNQPWGLGAWGTASLQLWPSKRITIPQGLAKSTCRKAVTQEGAMVIRGRGGISRRPCASRLGQHVLFTFRFPRPPKC